ncbi:MATE family efflux transporter [Ruminococcus sp. AF21-42]|nr:MATE family efflux transporter [Ruminococcus sp. AF21-42]
MNTTTDLGTTPMKRLVLQLALPSMAAQFVNVLYSIIDRMYIGHISGDGALALAGAGVCGPVVTLLTSFGTLVGIGGSITMGIRLGEKSEKKARQVLANSFLMLCIFSLLLTVSFLLLKDQLLMLFGASDATFSYANTYLTIYTAGTFFALMATGLNYFINCQGFPLVGMTTVFIGAIANIILDPVFIFALHMGIAGAAIATVISQFLSCAFAMLFLFGKNPGKKVPVRITFGQYSSRVMKRIIALGFSPFLILATDSLILIIMNAVLQKYGGAEQGDMFITCATIAQSYLLLITAPMIGISGGTQAILSYNYGAKDIRRVKSAEKNILGVMLIFTTLMFFLSRIVPQYFVRLFTTDQTYMNFSVWAIRTYTLMIIPLSFQYVFVDGLTALERPKTGLALSVFRKSLFVLSAVILPQFFSARSAFFAEPVCDGISSVISTITFLLIIEKHLQKRLHAVVS